MTMVKFERGEIFNFRLNPRSVRCASTRCRWSSCHWSAGCPPCYPPDLDFPLCNVPEKYEIISYWQSLSGTGLVVLTAQLSNWTKSHEFQKRSRQYYVPRRAFPMFIDGVCNRRRRHELEEYVYLLPDPEQQSWLQNWIDFQNYHLNLHEDEERNTKNEKDKLEAARWRLGTSGEKMSILGGRVKYGESKLEEHSKMLRWIDQQRKEMVAEEAASAHTTKDHYHPTNMLTFPYKSRRTRHQKSLSPFASVWTAVFKKPPPRQRSLRHSKCNAP